MPACPSFRVRHRDGPERGAVPAYKQIADGPEYARLDTAQRKIVDNALRDFKLSGIALPPEHSANATRR
jgi:oligopeptidase A